MFFFIFLHSWWIQLIINKTMDEFAPLDCLLPSGIYSFKTHLQVWMHLFLPMHAFTLCPENINIVNKCITVQHSYTSNALNWPLCMFTVIIRFYIFYIFQLNFFFFSFFKSLQLRIRFLNTWNVFLCPSFLYLCTSTVLFLIIYSVCTDETAPTQAFWWFQMYVLHILSHNMIFWVHFY